MKTRQLTRILCMAALAGSAMAAQQDNPAPSSSSFRPSSIYDRSSTTSSQTQSAQCIRASQVIGSTVKSSNGKIIGQVRDLVADPQAGRIDFAVLSLSGATGASAALSSSTPSTTSTIAANPTSYSASSGAKLVPVPWQLFGQSFHGASTLTPGSSAGDSLLGNGTLGGTLTFTLNIDEAKLQGAPSFDANNWSILQENGFGQRSYTYYGLDWHVRMSGAGTAGSGVSSGVGASSSDRNGAGAGTSPKLDTGPLPDRGAAGTTPLPPDK